MNEYPHDDRDLANEGVDIWAAGLDDDNQLHLASGETPDWIEEIQAQHTARMAATGPLESIDDAIVRMPRYTSEAVEAAREIDDAIKALGEPSWLPFKIIWRWQFKRLREKSYHILNRTVVIGTAWRLIAHHRRLEDER